MKKVILFVVFLPMALFAQEINKKDVWEPLRFFIGNWQGEIDGKSGVGDGEREYRFILADNYILIKNKATFAPQEKNPDGEIHEDWGIFSYDQARKSIILRQFNSEGFVNQYIVDSISADYQTLVLTTEVVENAPQGMRARYILSRESDSSFTEIFELAWPGREFAVCLQNRWSKK